MFDLNCDLIFFFSSFSLFWFDFLLFSILLFLIFYNDNYFLYMVLFIIVLWKCIGEYKK